MGYRKHWGFLKVNLTAGYDTRANFKIFSKCIWHSMGGSAGDVGEVLVTSVRRRDARVGE